LNFFDVNGDGFSTPADALRVINALNAGVRAVADAYREACLERPAGHDVEDLRTRDALFGLLADRGSSGAGTSDLRSALPNRADGRWSATNVDSALCDLDLTPGAIWTSRASAEGGENRDWDEAPLLAG
jgi:hypothetical protein